MNGQSRGESPAERTGGSQFDTGSGRVHVDLKLKLVLVNLKHTLVKSGKAIGVYTDGRPVSFMSIPLVGRKCPVQNEVPAVRAVCAFRWGRGYCLDFPIGA